MAILGQSRSRKKREKAQAKAERTESLERAAADATSKTKIRENAGAVTAAPAAAAAPDAAAVRATEASETARASESADAVAAAPAAAAPDAAAARGASESSEAAAKAKTRKGITDTASETVGASGAPGLAAGAIEAGESDGKTLATPDPKPAPKKRGLMAAKLLAAAKADVDYVAPVPQENKFMALVQQAKSISDKLEENARRDAAAAAQMEADRAIPKWKRDAVEAKRVAAEKKRLRTMSPEEKKKLADAEASRLKADSIRLKTIAKQVDLEKEEMMAILGQSRRRKRVEKAELRASQHSSSPSPPRSPW